MQADEVVPAVCATVKQVYKPKKGGEGDKAYKFQDVILIDGKVEFKMTIKDRFDWDMPNDWKGKRIMVNCHSGTRGLTGVKIKDTSYDGEKGRVEQVVLWVTGTGEIALEGAEGGKGTRSQGNDEGTPPPSQQQQQQPKSDSTPPPAGSGKPNFGAVKKKLLPFANLYFLTCDAANYVSKCREKVGSPAFTADELQACRATLFIEYAKNGDMSVVPNMPLLEHLHAPGSPEAKAAAEQAAKAAEEEKKKKAEAEEAERIKKAAEERKKKAAESEEEDVPF